MNKLTQKLLNDDLYYNPDIKYYMVSTIYYDKFGLPSHVRAPWLTAESAKKYAQDAINNPKRYSDFEIFDEATLDIKVFIKNSSSEFEEITLRELLFKDGNFRWNRLENLLRNAKQSDDYDLDRVLDQTLDFLFSERGEFIRDRLVDELVNGIDLMGRNTLQTIRHALEERIGLPLTAPITITPEEQDSLDRFQRISEILRNSQGFDPWRILQTLPKLASRPELQSMGQQVVGDLAQKAIARLIRSLLVQELETA